MKLTKVIPQQLVIDTTLIKKGDIFEIEDTLSCSKTNYIVLDVNQSEMDLTSLTRGGRLTIKIDQMSRFVFNKMRLVREDAIHSKPFNTDHNPVKESIYKQKLEKEECEQKTDEYAKEISKMINTILGTNYNNKGRYA